MANVIKPKRSSTSSSAPTTSDLADGEIAVNTADQKIYMRSGGSIVTVGNVGSGIDNVSEDTSPQLGGNLDLNSNNITGTGNITTTGDLTLTDTTDDSAAGPEFEFYRNSPSPADGDYLGQIKFQGENDADQKVLYAKITGKINDASDTTEDGLIEYAVRKAGTHTIVARLTGTALKLLNSTGLEVAGNTETTGNIGVGRDPSSTNLDTTGVHLNSSGVVIISRDYATPLNVRRNNDGDLIRLRRATSNIGAIGVDTNDNVQIYSSVANHSGLEFGTHIIQPLEAGSASNGTIDLGGSSAKFKDIYAVSLANGITATTQSTNDNSTKVATTAFVTTAVSGASGGISNVVEDTTPQLGGDLDLNSNTINGTGGIDITGQVRSTGNLVTTAGLANFTSNSTGYRQYNAQASSGGGNFLLGKIRHNSSDNGAISGVVNFGYDYGSTTDNVNLHFTFAQRNGTIRGHWWYENTDDDAGGDNVKLQVIDDGSGGIYVWLILGDFATCAVECWWRQTNMVGKNSGAGIAGALSSGTVTSGTTSLDTSNDPTAEMHIGKLYAHSTIHGSLNSDVTATTQSTNDNSTKVATTAYVKQEIDELKALLYAYEQ